MKIKLTTSIHWITYTYFVYLFGYASLFKVFQKKAMMEGMMAFGFNKTWTLFIGYGELIGLLALIIGLWFRPVKNIAIIYLLFFAVGALMVHFAHKEYHEFYSALFGCMAAIILLATDKHFKLVL